MLEPNEALARILAAVPPPGREEVALDEAAGRAAAEALAAPLDLPSFDNSAVDGYALHAADARAACPGAPARLRLCERRPAGAGPAREVPAEACARLFTGWPVPPGADAVVMQEDTRVAPEEPGTVLVLQPVKPGENVRWRGEDVKRGARVVEAGERLTAGRIGLLAAMGCARVLVGRRPVAGLLATGSELREPSQPLGPGQIYESNRPALAALVHGAGAVPRRFPLVADTLDATRSALAEALAQCDAVVSSGGVSIGEPDFIKDALAELGGSLEFWRVAMRPGRPFVFGRWREKLLFGLPGNPVSAVVAFLLLVRPALLRWQGAGEIDLPAHPGVLAEPLANPGAYPHFLRVRVDAAGQVYSTGLQASHALGSLAAANGLVQVPPHTTLPRSSTVSVRRWF